MSKQQPMLSISMLVSNGRRDTIEKCMESLIPFRNAVSCELILVDTGCTDGSIDIARKYADKVVEFTWCNDFSAARNAGLSECTGRWFLYLDDDEWFEDVSEIVDFLKGKEEPHCDTLWYLQRNYDDFEGTSYIDSYVARMVKMTAETKFHGKIHEWLEPLPRVVKKVGAYVHHYGYVYKDETAKQKHLQRNLPLIEESVKENPKDIRMCCQLIQEYRSAQRYEEALALCRRTLEITPWEETNSFVQYVLLVIPRIYKEQKKYKEAREEMDRLEREVLLLHQTKLALYYERAAVYSMLQMEEELRRDCKNYLEEYKEEPKAGGPQEFPVMDFAYFTSDLIRRRTILFGVKSMLRSEVYEDAEYFFDQIEWSGKTKTSMEFVAILLQTFLNGGEEKLLTKYLPVVLKEKDLETVVYATLHSQYENNPDKRELLLAVLEKLDLRSGNLGYFHLLYLNNLGKVTEQDLAEYYEKSDRKYDAEVLALFFEKPELLPYILDKVTNEVYTEAVTLLARKTEEEITALLEQLPQLENIYPEEKRGFLYYANMVLAEKCLMFATEKKTQVTEALQNYLYAVQLYGETLYHPALLSVPNHPMLPANIRFATVMMQAETVASDFSAWAEHVKEAAKIYPPMLPMVKALLEEKKNAGNIQQSAANAQNEMLALAEQLKAMVRTQMAEGKSEEAKAILSELSMMLPEDEEVKEMLKNL